MAELEPRNFLQPCLLLLLREQPDHGYELAARLRPMHDGDGDAGGVYRALRALERNGLVRSEWQTSAVGPARRTYYVTAAGCASLAGQARDLASTHEALHVFMDRYARLMAADLRGTTRDGGADGQGGAGRDGAGSGHAAANGAASGNGHSHGTGAGHDQDGRNGDDRRANGNGSGARLRAPHRAGDGAGG